MTRLNPFLPARLSALAQAGRTRGPLLRRLLAAGLALAGTLLLIRGNPGTAAVTVVAARGDLRPGIVLQAADVQLLRLAASTVPAGAVRELPAVVGHTLAGAVREGETLTDVRILSPRLAPAATGAADARIVPVRLADSGVAELLRPGDRVDVITTTGKHDAAKKSSVPRVLAPAATVILVTPAPGGRGTSERIVMIALPAQHAAAVAGSSLTSALTVLLR